MEAYSEGKSPPLALSELSAQSAHLPVCKLILKLPGFLSLRVGLRTTYSRPSNFPPGSHSINSERPLRNAAALMPKKTMRAVIRHSPRLGILAVEVWNGSFYLEKKCRATHAMRHLRQLDRTVVSPRHDNSVTKARCSTLIGLAYGT